MSTSFTRTIQMLLAASMTVAMGCSGETNLQALLECDSTKVFPQPGSCPDPTIDKGDPGGACIGAPWTGDPKCPGAHLDCVAGACIPCGTPGTACCSDDLEQDTCHQGVCGDAVDGFRICESSSCAGAGEPCCAQEKCDEGLSCVNGTCGTELQTSCGGSNQYYASVRSIVTKCADPDPVPVAANSSSEAMTCLQTEFDTLLPGQGLEVVAVHSTLAAALPTAYPYCDPNFQVKTEYIHAFSSQDAHVCMTETRCGGDPSDQSCWYTAAECP